MTSITLPRTPFGTRSEEWAAFAKKQDFVPDVKGPDATLFINGDFIDFAQIPPYDVPAPRHLPWPEAASLAPAASAFPYAEAMTYFARALGAAGEAGVTMALEIMRKELDVTMALCGLRDIQQVDGNILVDRDPWPSNRASTRVSA